MNINSYTFAVPTSVASGAATELKPYERLTVQIVSVGTATYQFQLSQDGTNWVNEGSAQTADGTVEVTAWAHFGRWDCTAYTDGTPSSTGEGIG